METYPKFSGDTLKLSYEKNTTTMFQEVKDTLKKFTNGIQFTHILLAGRASRMPAIKQVLQEIKATIHTDENVDTVLSMGTTICAQLVFDKIDFSNSKYLERLGVILDNCNIDLEMKPESEGIVPFKSNSLSFQSKSDTVHLQFTKKYTNCESVTLALNSKRACLQYTVNKYGFAYFVDSVSSKKLLTIPVLRAPRQVFFDNKIVHDLTEQNDYCAIEPYIASYLPYTRDAVIHTLWVASNYIENLVGEKIKQVSIECDSILLNASFVPGNNGYALLKFGISDKGEDLGKDFEIVAHETGHSILHAICSDIEESIHETVGDIIALVSMLHIPERFQFFEQQITDPKKESSLTIMGELNGSARARRYNNSEKMTKVSCEEHEKSKPLTGALFDILVKMCQNSLKTGFQFFCTTFFKTINTKILTPELFVKLFIATATPHFNEPLRSSILTIFAEREIGKSCKKMNKL